MSEAPERIRVWPDYDDHFSPARHDWTGGIWDDTDDASGIEYIRADLSQAAVEAALRGAAEQGSDIAERTRPDGMPYEASIAYYEGAMDVVRTILAMIHDSGAHGEKNND